MKHTIAVWMKDTPSVLARISGLFSRRGFNIESVAVGVTNIPDISRMTIVVSGDDSVLAQVTKQLYKLIDVIKVRDMDPDDAVGRELAMFKVTLKGDRHELIELVNIFGAKIVDVGIKTVIVSITGTGDEINTFEELLRKFSIKEVTRTGMISMKRCDKIKPGK